MFSWYKFDKIFVWLQLSNNICNGGRPPARAAVRVLSAHKQTARYVSRTGLRCAPQTKVIYEQTTLIYVSFIDCLPPPWIPAATCRHAFRLIFQNIVDCQAGPLGPQEVPCRTEHPLYSCRTRGGGVLHVLKRCTHVSL